MDGPADILLVDDNAGDIELTQYALLESGLDHNFHAVESGEDAMAFLRRQAPHADAPRPDLVLLDLNMPGMSGHSVLSEIKSDEALRSIPVAILTSSKAPRDIDRAYANHANSYVTKRVDLDEFIDEVTKAVCNYWFRVVELPPKG